MESVWLAKIEIENHIFAPKIISNTIFSNKYHITLMGKGDPKTKRGKIVRGSHGKTRPKLKKLKTVQQKPADK